ncbi:uncharacterized protein LOC134203916 [Armigeres subalbatus]|uniref:uncharacterized protein LOC134203916 n=1 Tax=Armigeres subalbatus TaxID=124917 RepID=UPI002ED0A86C
MLSVNYICCRHGRNVVYLRFHEGNTVECALAGAKTRVAPLKFLSIPRSELQAALLGVQLADTILSSLSIKISKRYFWTDSKDVLYENGVARVTGRTKAREFSNRDATDSIILPRHHHITRLIIADAHERFQHLNHATIINELRQRFRISRLKVAYNSIRKDCQQWKNDRAKPLPPMMGDLPRSRMAAFSRPFTHMGVDYFGPLLVSVNRHSEKRWGVLATCLTTRAIHLQIAHTLSTDSCVMAIRNVMARRGVPAVIYSDRGTNFQGASKELKTAIQQLDQDRLARELTTTRTKWEFIPPVSPHMGGAWERLIRTVKQNLAKVQPSRLPTDEVLQNAMAEVENIVNSRPLTE